MQYALLVFFLSVQLFSATDITEKSPRFLIHILDYISVDYPGAIENGKVLSQGEYDEQKEFAAIAVQLGKELPELAPEENIQKKLNTLSQLILHKQEASLVAKEARAIELLVIEKSKLRVSPTRYPDLHHGKEIYNQSCASCHGGMGRGDGPSSGNLDPKPANFHADKADGLPPFQLYNAIRLGVPGTAMSAFSQFSDQEVWDLAFYVLSLRHGNGVTQELSVEKSQWSLEDIATKSDADLRNMITGTEAEKRILVARARLYSESQDSSQVTLERAEELLEKAGREYQNGDVANAKHLAILAYLDGIEPIEPKLRAKNYAFTAELEANFSAVRASLEAHLPPNEVDAKIQNALAAVRRAEELLKEGGGSPFFTFSIAAGIFLREAFEASLILITLLGVLKSVGATNAAVYVHLGWISALCVGVITWFFSGWLMQMSGLHREMLEGIVGIFAVVVLLYVGFWLHRKTEIGKWRTFIQDLVSKALTKKNLAILGVVSFMGVFRECFETVLFLRALLIESGPGQQWAMAAGVGSSLILVFLLSAAMIRYSAKIPVRQLFLVSSGVLVALSAILIGKAMHSFQETGIVSITPTPIDLRIDLFGVFPTYETLIPQILLLILVPFFLYGGKVFAVGASAHE